MSHPLDGCFARIERAVTHYESLKTAVATTDLMPDPVDQPLLKLESDVVGGPVPDREYPFELRCARDGVVPDPIGIIFGDLIHSLRAALDNLVYALAPTPPPRGDTKSAFPIVDSGIEWFTAQVADSLQYISPKHRAMVEAHQPFMERGGVPANKQVLARLRTYSNKDKHRAIQLGSALARAIEIENLEIVNADVIDFQHVQAKLHEGAVVAKGIIRAGGADARVHMGTRLDWALLTPDDDSTAQFCDGSIRYVADLIIEFAVDLTGSVPDWPLGELKARLKAASQPEPIE